MKQLLITKRGFSLIELLIVLAIGVAITGITYVSFNNYGGNQTLEKQTDVVQSYIEKARLQAINSKNFSPFGIKFASSSVTLFQGTGYSASSASNTVYTFSPKLQISSINLAGNVSEMYFSNVTGEPSATGTITLKLNNSSSTKVISIFGTGLSQVQ